LAIGTDAPGFSAATVSRLKANWQQDFDQWQKRDLSGKRYVYFWVDGIYCNVRMDDKQCLLVIIGATEDGYKELVAIEGGFRESELSWTQLLLDLKARGLDTRPSAGYRRRRAWILESTKPGICRHPLAALLGSQDG
jgi:putative transposase